MDMILVSVLILTLYLPTGHMIMILVSVFNSLSIHWTYDYDIGISINFNSLSTHWTYDYDIGISI